MSVGVALRRSILLRGPLQRAIGFSFTSVASAPTRSSSPLPFSPSHHPISLVRYFSIFDVEANRFDPLTDTRFPKRRPLNKSRRKRRSIRAAGGNAGPYLWVKYEPGKPIEASNPNKGSVKRRNEKKRIKLHRAFIKAEAKKRKAQMQEARKKKMAKRVERKMAAAARERDWAQRLVELQRLEEEKKQSMA